MGGQPEKWLYDDAGNVTEHWAMGVYDYTDARATRDTYTPTGQTSAESDPGNSTAPGQSGSSTTTYDSTGAVTQQTNPDGSWAKYSYDGASNSATTTVPLTQYNASSDPGAIATTTTTYTPADQQATQVEAPSATIGMTTTDGYDKAGEQTSAQGSGVLDSTTASPSPEPSSVTVYNNNNMVGWVLRQVDEDGVVTLNSYDTHGCITTKQVGSKSYTLTYDADNRLKTQTDADSNLLTNTYDAFGNLTEAKHTNGSTTLKDVQITVDSLGRPTLQKDTVTGMSHTWTYPVNSATGTQETIKYDATPLTSVAITRNARNVETSRVATIASGVTVTRTIADSTSGRDMADRWISASLQLTGQSAVSMGRTFNPSGTLATQTGAGYTSGNSATYTYDPASGQKASESIPLAFGGTIAESYTYYPDGRIHYYRQTGGIFGQYQYDSFGNLVVSSDNSNNLDFTYNTANQLTQCNNDGDVTQFGWDTTNGWRTSQGPTSNPTQIQYGYNAQGRMTSYSDSDDGISATYSYDAAGQRTKSVVNVRGTVTTTNWVYEGKTLLSLTATQGSSSWRIDYLYDENGVPYGGVYRSPATSTSPTYFTMVTDDRGDVVELLDAAGNPFAAYHYDCWGWINEGYDNFNGIQTQGTSLISSTLASSIVAQQHLTYAGYVYDSESNLYYCNARYYDPATRQWTTADPAKADGEESAYQYCGGNPVGTADPTGSSSHSVYLTTWDDDHQTGFTVHVEWDWNGLFMSRISMTPLRFDTGWGIWPYRRDDCDYWYSGSTFAFGHFERGWMTDPKDTPLAGLDEGSCGMRIYLYGSWYSWTHFACSWHVGDSAIQQALTDGLTG